MKTQIFTSLLGSTTTMARQASLLPNDAGDQKNHGISSLVDMNRLRSKYLSACAATAFGFSSLFLSQTATADTMAAEGLQVADFILGLQDSQGAIIDEPGSPFVNEDSNMEYALIGLAAAYSKTHDPRYLTGLEQGIDWIFSREDMSNTIWNGSWWGGYSSQPPYDHVALPDTGISDFRGVDTTSALPTYLLYLHQRVTGTNTMVNKWANNAKAGLDFVLRENLNADGLPGSSWQLINGKWKYWGYEYTSDTTDDYLGFRAGCQIYAVKSYCDMANKIQASIPLFFDAKNGRYFEGRDSGVGDWANEFDATFATTYPLWVFGATTQNVSAYKWALGKVDSAGALLAYAGDPGYSLAGCMLILGAQSLGKPTPTNVVNWVIGNINPPDGEQDGGGVRDTSAIGDDTYNNVAGFCSAALLGFTPF